MRASAYRSQLERLASRYPCLNPGLALNGLKKVVLIDPRIEPEELILHTGIYARASPSTFQNLKMLDVPFVAQVQYGEKYRGRHPDHIQAYGDEPECPLNVQEGLTVLFYETMKTRATGSKMVVLPCNMDLCGSRTTRKRTAFICRDYSNGHCLREGPIGAYASFGVATRGQHVVVD